MKIVLVPQSNAPIIVNRNPHSYLTRKLLNKAKCSRWKVLCPDEYIYTQFTHHKQLKFSWRTRSQYFSCRPFQETLWRL